MKFGKLSEMTGKEARGWREWLVEEGMGCCSLCFASDGRHNYAVCMGWHDVGDDDWKIAWKIGRQTLNNAMQSDLDMDFEMPYCEESGEVDDTLSVMEEPPKTAKEWEALAASMRKEARRVWKAWRDLSGEEGQ